MKLTIKIDSYTLAYIAAEKHGILSEWNKDTQYEILNAIREAINNTSPKKKAKIAEHLRNGMYHQSDSCKYMGENDTVVHLKPLIEPL